MTRPDPSPDAVQRAFEELGRQSFAQHSLQSLVQKVADVAARVLPGDPATSVTILTRDRPRTVAASHALALDLDRTQYELGSGPCLQAASTGGLAACPDTGSDDRWPQFAARAAELGCRSVLSVPLPVQELVAGGLNVYLRGISPSDDATRALAERLASYAVVPVSNMYLYSSAAERVEHLQAALDSRAVIDQAKGILMERFKLTADQAFQALVRVSMETNTKVRDVAEQFVQTGDLPGR
ncbi:ANTAR domain-containing protein [Geodermatophilus sp. SYSU D00815]